MFWRIYDKKIVIIYHECSLTDGVDTMTASNIEEHLQDILE